MSYKSVMSLGLGGAAMAAAYHQFDDGRPRVRWPQVREEVDHYESPRPLTKRQKRRLRGKGQ